MGKVFSTTDVEREWIPSESEFKWGVEAFRESIEAGVASGLIDGGVVYGSVAIGVTNLRSDFDCMIVPVDHSDDAIDAAYDVVADISSATNLHVPIGASIHHKARLATGAHEIDRFFGVHLTGSHRIVAGNDPAEYIRFSDTPANLILMSYLRHKKRTINTVLTSHDEPEYLNAAQRMLELPLAIGRKALLVIDEIEGTHMAVENSADKPAVSKSALLLYEELGVAETALELRQLDSVYTTILERTITGEVSLSRYDQFISNLAKTARKASRWLDELDVALQHRLGDVE